jgi:hypothetical protein
VVLTLGPDQRSIDIGPFGIRRLSGRYERPGHGIGDRRVLGHGYMYYPGPGTRLSPMRYHVRRNGAPLCVKILLNWATNYDPLAVVDEGSCDYICPDLLARARLSNQTGECIKKKRNLIVRNN